jgi:uncharacterized NAD(P)/FAD-binding protein YdhS
MQDAYRKAARIVARTTAASVQSDTTSARRIAIVGAGFCGVTVAIQLLRQAEMSGAGKLTLDLVDPRAEIGSGAAYATRDYPYPLNVAAGQMSFEGARPGDFVDYIRGQGIRATPGDYLPRQVYGEYLRTRFAEARANTSAEVTHRRASALQLRKGIDGRWDLWLDDGSTLRADDVVLALGNPPPAIPPELAPLANTPRYISDPWSIGSIAHQGIDGVLLVGSGLTMIDAALRLAAVRPRPRHIYVLSRHGLLPEAQSTAPLPSIKPDVEPALEAARGSTRMLTRAIRALMHSVDGAGGDWREVLALARPHLPDQWRSLGQSERARFLRHARAWWDIHRHRVPAAPLSAVHSLARAGVLQVHAGRIESVNPAEDIVEVIWRPRGAARTRAWLVDRVINCTGPECRIARDPDPLVQSLLANGLIRADALAVGLDVDDDGRPLSRDGAPVDRLYYVGPWLRARDWEATAVPELREHAARLARRLCAEARSAHAVDAIEPA